MTYFEQVEVVAKTTKVTYKRPLTSTEKAAYGIIFDLCEAGKKLEAENANLKKHCEWLEGNLDLKNTVIADLKNQLRDALERC